jgi:adenine-specific DNA methylase
VAALLTWAALNIVGGGKTVAEAVQKAQQKVYNAVDHQITAWGIEHREPDLKTGRRWRADAYLYCVEATCPECGWRVPMAPSWVVAEKTNVIVRLVPDPKGKRSNFDVVENASAKEMQAAAEAGTAKDSELVCPHCKARTPIRVIRGDGRGKFSDSKNLLRGWESRDVVPRPDDIFGERLYCVRWIDTWAECDEKGEEKSMLERHYLAPTTEDLRRESKVLDLLTERFSRWQRDGYIPSRKIQPGEKTQEPIRTRGWTFWHHLFIPRQLLLLGLLAETSHQESANNQPIAAHLSLRLAACAD